MILTTLNQTVYRILQTSMSFANLNDAMDEPVIENKEQTNDLPKSKAYHSLLLLLLHQSTKQKSQSW